SHEFAVANGCNVQCTPLASGEAEIASLMERFEAACAKAPGVPRPKIMLLLHTYVGSDQADIDQAAKELSVYYNYFFAWFKNQRPISQGLIQRLSEQELAENPNLAPEMMKSNMPVGTPDEVIRRLKVYEDLGYNEYSLWIDSGMSF